jgi:hypothetical protein
MPPEMMFSLERNALVNQAPQDFHSLVGLVYDALKIFPPLYASSILGLPWTWLRPHGGFSEFKVFDFWQLRRTLSYLVKVSVPPIPTAPLPLIPHVLDRLFWQPTVILQRPDQHGNYTAFPEESWFFINGILSNDSLAQINAAYLAYLFHRPITLIHSASNSVPFDLLQCALGKEWHSATEAAIKAFPVIHEALKNPQKKKVVVIAHSQGTIVMAKVLNWLQAIFPSRKRVPAKPPSIPRFMRAFALVAPQQAQTPAAPAFVYPDDGKLRFQDFEAVSEAEMAKLEIYCFANCAQHMKYLKPAENGKPALPRIENFANEKDIIARLGMLAPHPRDWGIDIDGPRYVREGAWGHLLNAHYLSFIDKFQKTGRAKGGTKSATPYTLSNAGDYRGSEVPRLFSYLNGGRGPH